MDFMTWFAIGTIFGVILAFILKPHLKTIISFLQRLDK
jgi:ABC-type lipoprotein release transport system permease subunit